MAIETDLSVAPYFDEADAGLEKNYYKILFKPSVPVQVRELNELQSILQKQIEEFGDNVLKKGTIVRGCTFSFFNNYPYVKIRDSQVDGTPINVSAFNGKILTSATGHQAVVLDYADGFESTDPDTKTLYLRYTNSGTGGGNTAFSAGDILNVQDPNYGVSNVIISIAGTGYSNNDTVVFVSAVAVTDITGTITTGTTMTQPNTGANAVVVAIDTTTYPDKTILLLRPTTTDLSDANKSANAWTFSVGGDFGIKSSTNNQVTAVPIETIGSGASAVVTTDGSQRVSDISMVSLGSGYYVAPYVTVRSTDGGTGVVLTAQNYSARITVYNGVDSVGLGYAFGVSPGVIYQKGYFLNVPEQTIVVSKYDRLPNNRSVGFSTTENIVDAYEDTSLLDNALGTRNYTAPGADRLQLTPELQVVNTDIAKANLEFFSIVEFSDGVPYKQQQRTAYNGITDEMAIRTSEASGDFVTDQFLVACKTTTNSTMRANTFTVVVDPGTAYIDGYRVNTFGNYQFTLNKGIDTETKLSSNVSLNYGSYVVVDNLAGSFNFGAVGTVKLYSTAKQQLANSSLYQTGTISEPTGQIGTAKIRSLTYVEASATGVPQGSASSKYNMYLFDIQMSPGKSFKDVRSIYYDGATHKGVADVVTESIATAGNPDSTSVGAVLRDTVSVDRTTLDKLVFYSGFDSPLSINTISYQYRTFDDSGSLYTLSNTGIIEISLSGNEYFPYSTTLTDSQKQQLVIAPLQDVLANAASGGAGNAVVSSATSTISSSNTSFTTALRIGDYVKVSGNSTQNNVRRVVSVQNGTHMVVDAAPSFTNSTSSVTRMFPKYVPLPILTREAMTATASISSQTLTINLGTRLAGTSTTIPLAASFNISVSNSAITTKTANRNLFVKIYPANNTTGFGYAAYGSGVDGYFTSGSNQVANSVTSSFSAGQRLKIVKDGRDFLATVGTITNSTFMNLSSVVNFTGNADIYPAVNSNGPWCLGVPDIFRLRAVYMANTSTVNVNSFDVTRDFVIDHNHNPNFADLGYLVKKKESTLVIGPNDYLLVQFDAFTRSHEDRPVLINSYVSSNSTTRAEVDAKPLSELNSTYINTLEIPEIYSSAGTMYDMISHIDFRPSAANTANLATVATNATLNPPYTVTFSGTNKKIPAPDSIMNFTSEYFLGRVDTVYMGSDGRVGTSKGHPYPSTILNTVNVDDLLTSTPNKKTMILNHIKIPAYPSVEENSSSSVYEIMNKNVINEIALTKRMDSKQITRILSPQNIAIEQPRRYSMEDIGSLERRIRDLEYYVSLSNLELSLKDLNLPSSIAANINRFKFGFFADNFDDTRFTDVDSVEYAAAIEDNRVIPPYETFKVEIPAPACEYYDYSVVSQVKATGNALPICVNTAFIELKEGGETKVANGERITSSYVTMAGSLGNTSGQVSIYMYFYSGADVMRIYQSSTANSFPATPILTTKDSVPLTATDITYMKALPTGWFGGSLSLTSHNKVTSPTNGMKYGGKITFNHNPANGRYYRIDVANYSIVWRYRIEYPINVDCSTNVTSPVAPVLPVSGSPNYNGTMKILTNTLVSTTVLAKKQFQQSDLVTAQYYRLHVTVTGLKPSTLHKMYFNKTDLTHLCDTTIRSTIVPKPPVWNSLSNLTWQQYSSQIPDIFNDAPNGYVMTDAAGQVELYLYVLADENISSTSYEKGQSISSSSSTSLYEYATSPTVEIYNTDKSSYAYVVSPKTYKLFSGFKAPPKAENKSLQYPGMIGR